MVDGYRPASFAKSLKTQPCRLDAVTEVTEEEATPVTDTGNNICKNRSSFWDELGSDQGSVISLSDMGLKSGHVLPALSNLRKKRSSAFVSSRFLSSISLTSVGGVDPKPKRLKKRVRPVSSAPTLTSSSSFFRPRPTLKMDLPRGIEQMGQGIGFRHNVDAGRRSTIAFLPSSTPKVCSPLFSWTNHIFRRHTKRRSKRGFGSSIYPSDIQPTEIKDEDQDIAEVLQEIEGGAWSRSFKPPLPGILCHPSVYSFRSVEPSNKIVSEEREPCTEGLDEEVDADTTLRLVISPAASEDAIICLSK